MENSVDTRSVSGSAARRRSVIGALAILAALLSGFPPDAGAQEKAPVEVVAAYQETIVEAAKKSEFDARYKALEPAVREAYDLPYIARRSIGSQNWNALSEEQQKKFAETYAQFSIATHASRFSEYRGDGFRQVETKDMPRGYKLVRTELQRNRLDNVVISYLMQERDGGWKIVDVFLQGTISEVATRKAEFTTVIRDKGFDALLNLLEQRIQNARQA